MRGSDDVRSRVLENIICTSSEVIAPRIGGRSRSDGDCFNVEKKVDISGVRSKSVGEPSRMDEDSVLNP